MKINKTNVKKMVWVSGTQGRYELNIDTGSIEEGDDLDLLFWGSVEVSDYRTAMQMQNRIREALVGLDIPEKRTKQGSFYR